MEAKPFNVSGTIISCLIFMLFLSLTANGNLLVVEKSKLRIKNLHYQNSSGERGITIYEYDPDGIAQTATWKLLDGTRCSENYHTYDQSGNLLMKYREFSDGLISYNRYEYDEHNHLVKETFERSDSVSGQTFYYYDQEGFLYKADCQGLNGWFFGIIDYECTNGILVGASIIDKSEKIGKIVYEYNTSGYLLSESWEFQNGWSQHFRYEYEEIDQRIPPSYTSSNVFITNNAAYLLIKEEYDFNGETGGPSFFNYSEEGALKTKIFERSDSFRTETSYTYASGGLLLHSFRNYSNGLTAEFNYDFDGNRRLTSRRFKRSDGVSGSEKYFYTEKGWLVSAIYTNFDSWLTGKIEFNHDKNGRINRGHFISDDGFTAEIGFEYDSNENVSRIHWEFSFGKTQTYVFEYERID